MARTLEIPDQLYSRLIDEARAEGLGSVEEWLQALASKLPIVADPQLGGPTATEAADGVIGPSLDEFIGDWSEAEAREFLAEVEVFDRIDESLWQ
ncbi:MAG: hypothetical protein MI919_37415 [Holophagales bacterium]|nr:hypothetical protein [Holophagales bacterium]